jgi:hypothetical protein
MTMEAQIPRFDPALVALLWEIKGVQKTTKEIKPYSRKLLIFQRRARSASFWIRAREAHGRNRSVGMTLTITLAALSSARRM